MTRRRFYAVPAAFDLDKQIVLLSADEARHARDVLRLRTGDEVYVFDGAGKEFRGTIREFLREGATLELKDEVEPARAESSLELTLAVAQLKGEKFDLVIQKSVELGVKQIVSLVTDRGDVQLKRDEDVRKRLRRWQRVALEAATQSGRAYVPEVAKPLPLSSFLSTTRPDASATFFFSERDGEPLTAALQTFAEGASQVVAIIGPEGGWSDEEIVQARAADCRIVTLGGRTLRAETAAIVIVALLQHRLGDLD
jgi:16S rRNA (uracil1498-N3)-methyltransferase